MIFPGFLPNTLYLPYNRIQGFSILLFCAKIKLEIDESSYAIFPFANIVCLENPNLNSNNHYSKDLGF